jgi:hypothetical protein
MKYISLLVVLLAVCMPLPVFALAETPPFEFANTDALELSAQDQTAQVVILNNTTIDLTLTLSLGDLLPAGGKAQPATSPFSLVGEVGSRILPAAGQIMVQIRVDDGTVLAPGDYVAYLTAATTTPAYVTRRQVALRIKPPAVTKGRLSATVDAWTVKLTQKAPHLSLNPLSFGLVEDWNNAALPVQMTGVVSLPIGVIGTLAGSNEGAAEVRARDVITSDAGWLSMPLSINAALTPGTYTGSITLAKDSTVKLSLLVADHWIWPLIVVLVVVWIVSYSISRFTNVLNKVWQLRERLEDAYHKLNQPPTEGYAGFTLTHLGDARESDLVRLRKLETYSKLDTGSEDYKCAQARIVVLEGLAIAWVKLPATLTKLKETLDHLEQAHPNAPESQPWPPQFIDDALTLVLGTPCALDVWTQRVIDLGNAQSAATAWLRLYGAADAAWLRIEASEPALGTTHDEWERNKRTAHSLRMSLWLDSAAQISTSEFATQVVNITNIANGWVPHTRDLASVPKELLTVESQPESARGCLPGLLSWLLKLSIRQIPPPTPTTPEGIGSRIRGFISGVNQAITSSRAWRLRRRFGGLATLLVAAFIAGATALNQVYFGKPFGTLIDYVNLVVWTAGVNAVVGGVLTALDKVLLRKES